MDIEPGAVAVIPSTRIIQQGKREELFPLFSRLIALLLDQGRSVYVIRHSYQDLAVCRAVHGLFADEPRVRLIDDDLDCLDLSRLLGRFALVIAARYHAMVHAYKSAVPVLALGWAVKYEGLLRIFGQERYLVEVRNGVDIASVEGILRELLARRDEEAAKIAKCLDSLRQETIFGDLGVCASNRKILQ
jgi:colanic acid/amylovoran biosynthesis protein